MSRFKMSKGTIVGIYTHEAGDDGIKKQLPGGVNIHIQRVTEQYPFRQRMLGSVGVNARYVARLEVRYVDGAIGTGYNIANVSEATRHLMRAAVGEQLQDTHPVMRFTQQVTI